MLSGIHGNEYRGYDFFPIPIANIGPLAHCLAQPQINSTMVGLLSLCNTRKQRDPSASRHQPLVLIIVMLPFPPSVWIFVLPITSFPENAEVG